MTTPNREAFRDAAAFAVVEIDRMVATLDTPSPFDELLLSVNRQRLGVFATLLTLYGLAIGEARDARP